MKKIARHSQASPCLLRSRDITLPRPVQGEYHLLLVAKESFHELLITAIMDYPPDAGSPAFTIQRIGQLA